MTSLHEVIAALIDTGYCAEADLCGCGDDDLDDLELRFDLTLDPSYRAYMNVAGRTRCGAGFVGDPFSLHIDDVVTHTTAYRQDHERAPSLHRLVIARRWLTLFTMKRGDKAIAGLRVNDIDDDDEFVADDVYVFILGMLQRPRALNEAQRANLVRLQRIDWEQMGVAVYDEERAACFVRYMAGVRSVLAGREWPRRLGQFTFLPSLVEVPRLEEALAVVGGFRLHCRERSSIYQALLSFIAWEGFDLPTRRRLWADGDGANVFEPLIEFFERGGGIDARRRRPNGARQSWSGSGLMNMPCSATPKAAPGPHCWAHHRSPLCIDTGAGTEHIPRRPRTSASLRTPTTDDF